MILMNLILNIHTFIEHNLYNYSDIYCLLKFPCYVVKHLQNENKSTLL